jgi:putative DNA primase/helicase
MEQTTVRQRNAPGGATPGAGDISGALVSSGIVAQDTKKSEFLDAALAYSEAGLCPVVCDRAAKYPKGYDWKQYQDKDKRPDQKTLQAWFGDGHADGLCLICGETSGNLEAVDFDAPELWADWCACVEDLEPGLLSKLVILRTQGGGYHLPYHCPVIGENDKLAQVWKSNGDGKPKKETLIETRGEGGLIVTYPTEGYTILQGDLLHIPTITPSERAILFDAARSFHQATDDNRPGQEQGSEGGRPGDDYDERGDVLPLLEAHGWQMVSKCGDAVRLRRPGKDRGGCSATWNYIPRRFYVFSTNAYPFDSERTYTPFGVYGTLEHGGDFKAAARELAVKGFGSNGTTPAPKLLQAVDNQQNEVDPETLLKHGPEDEGNAQTVAELHGNEFLHVAAYGWMYWTGTHWEREGAETLLDRAIVETLKLRRAAAVLAEQEAIVKAAKPSAYRVRGCKYLVTSILRANVADFDKSPDLLNCQNGVVDLRDGQLTPHDPSQRYTYCLPVDFDLYADQSEWRAFLQSALGDDQDVLNYAQESVGYSITGHTSEEILHYIFGPTRAGKGTFTETLMAMLGGRPLADEVDFATFTADRTGDTQNFDLAGLKPCRFIVASESSKYSQLNASKIKALTGGNEIRCAHKHKDFFTYRPQFKIWLSSNHPVNADVDDDAAWYRVRVIHFPRSFAGREDKTLKARLREPHNLRGVLAWAVQGAMAWYGWQGKGGLQTPEAVTLATQEARQELDFVGQWLDECIETTGDPENFVTNAALYASYEQWCENNGVTPKQKRSLSTALSRKGITTSVQKKVDGRNTRGCEGVRVR